MLLLAAVALWGFGLWWLATARAPAPPGPVPRPARLRRRSLLGLHVSARRLHRSHAPDCWPRPSGTIERIGAALFLLLVGFWLVERARESGMKTEPTDRACGHSASQLSMRSQIERAAIIPGDASAPSTASEPSSRAIRSSVGSSSSSKGTSPISSSPSSRHVARSLSAASADRSDLFSTTRTGKFQPPGELDDAVGDRARRTPWAPPPRRADRRRRLMPRPDSRCPAARRRAQARRAGYHSALFHARARLTSLTSRPMSLPPGSSRPNAIGPRGEVPTQASPLSRSSTFLPPHPTGTLYAQKPHLSHAQGSITKQPRSSCRTRALQNGTLVVHLCGTPATDRGVDESFFRLPGEWSHSLASTPIAIGRLDASTSSLHDDDPTVPCRQSCEKGRERGFPGAALTRGDDERLHAAASLAVRAEVLLIACQRPENQSPPSG